MPSPDTASMPGTSPSCSSMSSLQTPWFTGMDRSTCGSRILPTGSGSGFRTRTRLFPYPPAPEPRRRAWAWVDDRRCPGVCVGCRPDPEREDHLVPVGSRLAGPLGAADHQAVRHSQALLRNHPRREPCSIPAMPERPRGRRGCCRRARVGLDQAEGRRPRSSECAQAQ